MIVTIKTNVVAVENLEGGSCFKFDNNYYISLKHTYYISDTALNPVSVFAYNIKDSCVCRFERGLLVEPVKAEITIT